MDSARRVSVYLRGRRRMTPAQRRRLTHKARHAYLRADRTRNPGGAT